MALLRKSLRSVLSFPIFIFLFASMALAAPIQYSQIRSDHPRIWVTASTLAAMQARAQGPYLSTFNLLKTQTDGIAKAFTYLMIGNEANATSALATANSLITSIAADKATGASIERNISDHLYQLALIYDWTYNSPSISANDKKNMRAGIMSALDWLNCSDTSGNQTNCSGGGWPYTQYISDSNSYYYAESHNTEINGQMMIATLATAHDYTASEPTQARAQSYTQTLLNHFDSGWIPMLNRTMGSDGGWWMGLMYDSTNLEPQYMAFAAMDSAAGQNMFTINPALERHFYWLAYATIDTARGVTMMLEDQGFPYYRGAHYRLGMLVQNYYKSGLAKWFCNQIESAWTGTYSTMAEEPSENYFSKILWADSTVTAAAPTNLPLNGAFPSLGFFITREGWNPGDAIIFFKSMPYYQISHNHQNNGTFMIYRNGPQIFNTGFYDSDINGAHYKQYFAKAVAGNTVLIGPKPSGGGQFEPINNAFSVDPYSTNYSTNVYDGTNNYVYLKTDITNAYKAGIFPAGHQPTQTDVCSHCQRTFFYVRNISGWPDPVLVVADDFLGTQVYDKAWLLHSENQPTISGDLITTSDGSGKVFTKILLASTVNTTTVGGAGLEFADWSGTNHPFTGTHWKPADVKYGTWRVEVSPKTLALRNNFLHVLAPAPSATSAPPTITDISTGLLMVAVINNKVVAFPRISTGTLQTATYTVASGSYSTMSHLIAQVVPNGIYQVNGQSFTASPKGVLEFTMAHSANTTYNISYTGGTGSNDKSNFYPVTYPGPLGGGTSGSTPPANPQHLRAP